MTQFQKPALDIQGQIAHLRQLGMTINNEPSAKHFLAAIGYYRLSGYSYPFRVNPTAPGPHQYVAGTDFDVILDRYTCDRQMRVQVMKSIERVEVGIRTAISNHMSCTYGPHWYLDRNRFLQVPKARFDHVTFLRMVRQECRRSSEAFIVHYRGTYTQPPEPPSWMVKELLSIGKVSKVYDNLTRSDRKSIADTILVDGTTALDPKYVASWLTCLVEVRNACAHHARLLLKNFKISGKDPHIFPTALFNTPQLYPRLLMLELLLRAVAPASGWMQALQDLFASHPNVSPALYGFPPNWDSLPEWSAPAFTWPT